MERSALESLLPLQAVDSELDALHERRKSLPARERLEAVDFEVASLANEVERSKQVCAAVSTEMSRLDDEVAYLTAKLEEAETKLYGGTVTSSRELQALQADAEMLKTQRAAKEELELEAIARLESAEATLAEAEKALADAEAEREAVRRELEAAEGEIDAAVEEAMARRDEAVTRVADPIVLDVYEAERSKHTGVVISRLDGTLCGICRTENSTLAIKALASPAELPRCEHCGRILLP